MKDILSFHFEKFGKKVKLTVISLLNLLIYESESFRKSYLFESDLTEKLIHEVYEPKINETNLLEFFNSLLDTLDDEEVYQFLIRYEEFVSMVKTQLKTKDVRSIDQRLIISIIGRIVEALTKTEAETAANILNSFYKDEEFMDKLKQIESHLEANKDQGLKATCSELINRIISD